MTKAEKNRARVLRWQKEHPEKVAAKGKRYRKRHPEKVVAKNQRYNQNHPEKMRLLKVTWNSANVEKVRMWKRRRRARKQNAGGTFTVTEWLALKELYGNKCLACGKSEIRLGRLGRKLVPDHVIPLVKGGSNSIDNIQPLCHGRGGCNNSKGNKHVDYRK